MPVSHYNILRENPNEVFGQLNTTILPARTGPHSRGPGLADGSLGQAQLCHLPQMLVCPTDPEVLGTDTKVCPILPVPFVLAAKMRSHELRDQKNLTSNPGS